MVLIKEIADIGLDDCRQTIQAAGANGHHSSGNHTNAVLSSIFSYAVDEIKVLDAHPIKGMAKMFPAPQSRDRVLNDEEMAGFVRALKEDTISLCSAAVKVCLLNCPPFRPDSRRKQEGSRISLRMCLCRRTISGSR